MQPTPSSVNQMNETLLNSLAPHGHLRAGINMSNFLLVSGTTGSGEPAGLSPDVARAIARRLGVACELLPFDGAGLLADAAGQDVWDIGNVAVEPARAALIDFSRPYIQINANFLTRADSSIDSNEAADRRGVEIVVHARSAYELWLTANFHTATYHRHPTRNEAINAFTAGQGDLLACLKPKLLDLAAAAPSLRIIEPPFTAIRQAIGLNKGHPEALAFVNQTLTELLDSGFIADSLERHGVGGKLSLPN